MTHARLPSTFADAATRVAGLIGYADAARIVARSERCLYDWANPASCACPSIAQALALDAAYLAAGGTEAPFHAAFAFQLGAAVDRQDACRRALTADLVEAARESGEAMAAALVVTNTNASPRDAHRAFAEADGAVTHWSRVKQRLASFLPGGAGPDAGKTGGTHA